ncbi:hypothetical protein EON66_11255 [archaeon]|nr:MAG: hypothetical protein EON66_11255 [archaeon]
MLCVRMSVGSAADGACEAMSTNDYQSWTANCASNSYMFHEAANCGSEGISVGGSTGQCRETGGGSGIVTCSGGVATLSLFSMGGCGLTEDIGTEPTGTQSFRCGMRAVFCSMSLYVAS